MIDHLTRIVGWIADNPPYTVEYPPGGGIIVIYTKRFLGGKPSLYDFANHTLDAMAHEVAYKAAWQLATGAKP